MGHYDDFYEEEARQRDAEKRQRNIRLMQEMDETLKKLGGFIGPNFPQGTRMREAYNNIKEEYVLWQHENDLLVRDPEILLDVLKGDK